MARFNHICTDPSHPPIIQHINQDTLYQQVSKKIADYMNAGIGHEDITRRVSGEIIPQLTKPSNSVGEGFRLQQMRQEIDRDWGDEFRKLDNLCHLTGWFINECIHDSDELHFVLCLFAFEAIRNMFATVNQLRAALTDDTFGYWRTLYETLIKSRFILKFSEQEPDIAGRLLCHTNSCYSKFYSMFASDDEGASDNMWIRDDKILSNRYRIEGKGDYAWAYPCVVGNNGKPAKCPTFRQLMSAVDKDSKFSEIYYAVSTSKTHGEFIWNALMVGTQVRGTQIDSFTVGNIGLVLDLVLPLFKEILENTVPTCTKPEHAIVMNIVRAIIRDVNGCVARIKASYPDMHGGLDI